MQCWTRRRTGVLDWNIIASAPEHSLMNQDKHVLIVGKNSYVGEFLSDHFAAQGAHVSAIGSSDCNFFDTGQVREFFRGLPKEPLTILFLAVVNKDVHNSYSAFQDNVQMAWNLVSNL